MFDFPKAIPEPRGCGEREPGGVYVECGLSDHGIPFKYFLKDPPLPVPEGKGKEELANKPQLWPRTALKDPGDPTSEYVVTHPGTDQPIVDLLLWIGAEHYRRCPYFIAEAMRLGVSRKLNPNLDLTLLTRESNMILMHPYVMNALWAQQSPPLSCWREIKSHARYGQDELDDETRGEAESGEGALESTLHAAAASHTHREQCLFKLWELIPESEASLVLPQPGGPPLCHLEVGSTLVTYRPTGESEEGLSPGIFAVLPITGIALIKFDDGSVNEKARAKIAQARERNGELALPHYESDK
jgi:hypothetical protein